MLPDPNGRRAPRWRVRPLVASLGLMTVVATIAGAGIGTSADAFVAGAPTDVPLRLEASAAAVALARAERTSEALGLPAGERRVARLADRFAGLVVDEVTTLD